MSDILLEDMYKAYIDCRKNKINIDKDEYYRLKKQNELLRIENDYLKELRRLNSQEIETQKQNQKLFSTSKKNTN